MEGAGAPGDRRAPRQAVAATPTPGPAARHPHRGPPDAVPSTRPDRPPADRRESAKALVECPHGAARAPCRDRPRAGDITAALKGREAA